MLGSIFNLAVEGLGKYTAQASGIFNDDGSWWWCNASHPGCSCLRLLALASYWVIIAMIAYILFYALAGCKNVNKDIPVE